MEGNKLPFAGKKLPIKDLIRSAWKGKKAVAISNREASKLVEIELDLKEIPESQGKTPDKATATTSKLDLIAWPATADST